MKIDLQPFELALPAGQEFVKNKYYTEFWDQWDEQEMNGGNINDIFLIDYTLDEEFDENGRQGEENENDSEDLYS